MKKIKNILFVGLLGISFVTSLAACGKNSKEASSDAIFLDPVTSPEASSEITNTPLTLSPSGVVTVNKDKTQQFTTNIQEASFSVEGGVANGSISAEGVYTPPARLPANTLITVKATLGEQTASAQVKLHTGDNIVFQADTNKKISDSFLHSAYINNPLTGSAKNQQLAILENTESTQVLATWSNYLASSPTSLFDKSINGNSFGVDQDISPFLLGQHSSQVMASDLNQNLHLITKEKTTGTYGVVYNLVHHYSEDQGNSFAPHTILLDTISDQTHASIAFDTSNRLHLVYANISYPLTQYSIRYTQSTDHGNTWSAPISLNLPSVSQNSKPSIVTDSSGNIIDICWTQEIGSQFDILYSRSSDGGNHFSAPLNITGTSSKREGECSIVRNKNDETLILYSGYIQSTSSQEDLEIFIAKTNDAINFNHKQVNTNLFHFQGMPIMAINDLGQIDILWTSDMDGNNRPESIIHARSSDGGNNFSSDHTAVTALPGNVAIPISMKHDSTGRLHLQYLMGLNYFYEIAE